MEIKSNWDKLEPYINRADFDRAPKAEVNSAAQQQVNPKSGDTVNLSTSVLRDLVAEEARNTPDVRQEKVDALKAQISSGQYQINTQDIAAELLGGAF
jgi:negative regulator of flagellin synthesis FlgM